MENIIEVPSSLPHEIMEKILLNLPLNDAINTSLLSKQWIDKWRCIPNLLFDFHDLKAFPWPVDESYDDHIGKMIHKVNQVLLLHIGEIWSFQFLTHIDVFSHMDIWMQYLVGFNLKKLMINIDPFLEKHYLIPYPIFDYENLVTIHLSRCQIKLPTSFNGFKNLTHLFLNHIDFVCNDAIDKLIWKCPLLKRIFIIHCNNCGIMKIHAPNLRFLKIIGEFSLLNFNETSNMTHAKIGLTQFTDCNFTNLLSILSNVEYLHLHYKTVSLLAEIDRFQFSCVVYKKMKTLEMFWTMDSVKEIEFGLYIIWKAPVLEKLTIKCIYEDQDNDRNIVLGFYIIPLTRMNHSLEQLRMFEMKNTCGTKTELNFIKYVLENAPLLQQFEITPQRFIHSSDGDQWFLVFVMQICQFTKASLSALIKISH